MNRNVASSGVGAAAQGASQARNTINTTPHIPGPQQTAQKLNVDPKLVDKLIEKLGADLVKELGPQYVTYLRTMSEALHALCDRSRESEIRALAAQCPPPNFKDFKVYDTSKAGTANNDSRSLASVFTNVDGAIKKGLLTKEQGDALKIFFRLPTNSEEILKLQDEFYEVFEPQPLFPPQVNVTQAQQLQSSTQNNARGREGYGGQQSQSHPDDEEPAEYDFSEIEESGGLRKKNLNKSLRQNMLPSAPPTAPNVQNVSDGSSTHSAMASTYDFVEQSFANSPFQSFWVGLLGNEEKSRQVMANQTLKMQEVQDKITQINAELAGISANDVKGMKQIELKIQEAYSSRSTMAEFLTSMAQEHEKLFTLISELFKIFNDAQKSIVNNVR